VIDHIGVGEPSLELALTEFKMENAIQSFTELGDALIDGETPSWLIN